MCSIWGGFLQNFAVLKPALFVCLIFLTTFLPYNQSVRCLLPDSPYYMMNIHGLHNLNKRISSQLFSYFSKNVLLTSLRKYMLWLLIKQTLLMNTHTMFLFFFFFFFFFFLCCWKNKKISTFLFTKKKCFPKAMSKHWCIIIMSCIFHKPNYQWMRT